VDVGPLVVADAQAPELIQPRKRAFHNPAKPGQSAPVPSAAHGEQRVNPTHPQAVPNGLGVVAAIAQHTVRTTRSSFAPPVRDPSHRSTHPEIDNRCRRTLILELCAPAEVCVAADFIAHFGVALRRRRHPCRDRGQKDECSYGRARQPKTTRCLNHRSAWDRLRRACREMRRVRTRPPRPVFALPPSALECAADDVTCVSGLCGSALDRHSVLT
jgi:hypothetical protein